MLPTAARAACDLTLEMCTTVMKAHISTLDNGNYSSPDVEDVCHHYASFLSTCASITSRLNVVILEKAALNLFGNDRQRNHLFAQRLANAFSYCKSKATQSTSGVKLSSSVKQVVDVMNRKTVKSPRDSKRPPTFITTAAPPQKTMKTVEHPSASSSTSAAAIYAMYGVETKAPPEVARETIPVLSSQEISDRETDTPMPIRRVYVEWVDFTLASPRMIRMDPQDGSQESVELRVGPGGFAIAPFASGDFVTEVPNLLLKPPPMPSTTTVRKKPAAAVVEDEDPEPADAPVAEGSEPDPVAEEPEEGADVAKEVGESPPAMTYAKLWYKHHHAFGIRQRKTPKTQIFTVGGKNARKSKERLSEIADTVIKMMEEEGYSEEQGKEWAKKEVSRPFLVD